MRISAAFVFLACWSCGSPEPVSPETEDQRIDGSDSLVEFEMDNERLEAVEFNNELTLMQQSIIDQVTTLFQSDSSSVDLNLDNTLFEIEMNLQSLQLMKAPDGGEEFVRTMTNVFEFYRAELTGEFKKMVPLIKAEELTKAQEKQLEEYDRYFAEQEKRWFDSVFVAQEEFAKANHIKLEE